MLFGCLGGCQKGWTLGAPIRVLVLMYFFTPFPGNLRNVHRNFFCGRSKMLKLVLVKLLAYSDK